MPAVALVFHGSTSYPATKNLRNALCGFQMGQLIVGPYSDHIRRCLDDVEQAQRSPGISAHLRGWLDDLAARLRRLLEEHRRREADERVNRG
jgi:hypothetical protein